MNSPSSADGELLYHYTSFEAFANIITKSELWASHIRYLNDTSEQRVMWELLKGRIEDRLSSADKAERERLNEALAVVEAPPEVGVYISSFCKDDGNRLSQWRGYSAGCGVSIGFKLSGLKSYCKALTDGPWKNPPFCSATATLSPVHYLNPTGPYDPPKELLTDSFLGIGPDFGLGRKDEASIRLPYSLSLLAASLKHSAFSEENEWRIILSGIMPPDWLKFRMRKSLPVPYVAFSIGEKISPLISKVVVGPQPHKEETMEAVKMMVQSTSIEVVGSDTPYRDW
jgi:hypothetical protein